MSDGSSVGRLVSALEQDVTRLAVGDRLPSTRELVRRHGVGPVTVQRAVAELAARGLVTTRPGAGTFVASPAGRGSRAAGDVAWQQLALGPGRVEANGVDVLFRLRAAGDALGLATGYLDGSLRPDGRLAAAMARAARRPSAWDTPPVAGVPELRSWFAGQLGAAAEDTLVTGGGQSTLSAVLRAVASPGDPVLFAVPTYPGALAVARTAGLVPVPVPTDADGVRPDLLERALASTGARVVYLQPTFANPDGHVLARDRRAEVLDAVRRAGAFVVEDDWARWLGHGRPAPPPLLHDDADGHVVTVTSLTKVAAPSLRVGAVVARGPVAQRIAGMRLVDDYFVPRPLQETAIELVSGPGWAAHLRAVGAALAQRLATLTGLLATHLPDCAFAVPRGGISLWLELPRGVDDAAVSERAAALGVTVVPGGFYTAGEPVAPHLRLSFAGVPEGLLEPAVVRLAQAVHQVRTAGTAATR